MRDSDNIEGRIRSAFRAVAELPAPQTTSRELARHTRRKFIDPGRRHPYLPTTIVAVLAVAAIVALVIAYGPRNGGKPASPPHVPTTQPSTTSPRPSSPTSTTTKGSPPVAVGTAQITYEPFVGSEVDPSLRVTSRESGACYRYGGGADGRYCYRCGTLQPCIAGPQGTGAPLVCPVASNPTTNNVTLWTATTVDTTGFVPATTKTPFAAQLSNGAVCVFVSAAWSGLGPYDCVGSGAATPADCRQPQAATPYWTASCQDQITNTSAFASITVQKVWF